jgi:predicted metal-dependent hydrolase
MQIQKVIRSNRKSIAITIKEDGAVVIRAPYWATNKQISNIVHQKTGWIQKKQAETRRIISQTANKKYIQGEEFLYLGKSYPLIIDPHQKKALTLNGHFSLAKKQLPQAEKVFTAWYRKHARSIITQQAQHYAHLHDFVVPDIRINSARTRWGSCGKGLNFTWRLVMAPIEIVDYVVVHELAHLKQKNHSAAYWSIVQDILPEYKKRRKWLKTNGHLLTL